MDDFYMRHVRLATTEALVYQLALKTTEFNCFSIEYIRWDAFFQHDRALSYNQVRNALFRLRRKGANIRHLARGCYKWIS